MKLAFLSTSMGMGGAGRQILNLTDQFRQKGHESFVVSLTRLGPMGEDARAKGVPVESLDLRRGTPDPRAVWKTVRWLRECRPHVLTSFMFHANLLGRLAGRLAGVPVIISSIRNENMGGPGRERIMRWTGWMDDLCTVNSRLAGEKLTAGGVLSADRLRAIPNGIVTEQYRAGTEVRARVRRELNVPQDGFLWLAVGRLRPQKDYSNLLDAFGKLSRAAGDESKGTTPRLYVAGKGPLQEELESRVQALGTGGRVAFLGARRDIPEFLAAADGFVLSSAWEGLPNAVMEAMAAGKPVVATRVGGTAELVRDGESGFLVPPGDSGSLAGAMFKVMEMPDAERDAMGRAGRRWVQRHYSLDAVVEQWEGLFRELLAAKGVSV